VKYFPHVRNLFINGDEFLEGFLGLSWFPSDSAKWQVDNYEKKVAALLFNLWHTYSSGWMMYEIGTASDKRVEIKPFAPSEFKKNVDQEYGDLAAKTGPKDGNYIDANKRGTPGKTCLPEKKSDEVKATGKGANTIVVFRPERWAGGTKYPSGFEGPGSAADEILIHELVHASRYVRGVANPCFGAPSGWDDYEEFIAITMCNVFSSQTRRKLRFGHLGFEKLSDDLSTSAAFLNKYKSYLTPIRFDHPHLFMALKRAPGIPFNPFALM
jgi:hypothetical protein